jgi:hypothetical protein
MYFQFRRSFFSRQYRCFKNSPCLIFANALPESGSPGSNEYSNYCAAKFTAKTQQLIFAKNSTMQSNDPLHGKTLEMILKELVHHFGWEDLGSIIKINLFI